MNYRSMLGAWLSAIAVTSAADNPTYSNDAYIIATGSSTQAKSSCFHMEAVIAEPVAGFSASTDFTMNAGFFAVATPISNDIFFNGFEDCAP